MAEKTEINPKMLPANLDSLKQHLEKTGNPAWTDAKGYGFLHACALFDAKESCNFLLQFLDPNMQDTDGLTPLAYAAVEDATEVISSLISHGAKVDLPCNDMDVYLRPAHIYTSGGKTPLMWACERKNIDAVSLLLQSNADPQKSDLSGACAIDYAVFGGSKECFDLLNVQNEHAATWPAQEERNQRVMDHLKITRDRIQSSAKGPAKTKLSKILDQYKPKHPRVYELDEEWMFCSELRNTLKLLRLQGEIQTGSKVRTPNGDIAICEAFNIETNQWQVRVQNDIQTHCESELELLNKKRILADLCSEPFAGIWTFPCFTLEFCNCLIQEIENIEIEAQRLFIELHRPNSMNRCLEISSEFYAITRPENRYGMVLNEVGFQKILDSLIDKLVSPLSNVVLPTCTACKTLLPFKSDYSFIIRYKQGEDLKLEKHVDSSDITLNVCLGKHFTGGKLYFHAPSDGEKFRMDHTIGSAVLHRGNVTHGAEEISSGERCNLIMWCRV